MQLFKLDTAKTVTPLLIGAFAFLSVGAFAQNKTDVAPKNVQTVKGEVIDMSCYMDHGAKGAKHKYCGQSCIKRGLPAGLLTADGQIYLLVENHANGKAYAAVYKYAADDVAITGDVAEKGGLKSISVNKIEKVEK